VRRVAKATGSLTGDETMEAEGCAGQKGIEGSLPHGSPAGRWVVESGGAAYVYSVHRRKIRPWGAPGSWRMRAS